MKQADVGFAFLCLCPQEQSSYLFLSWKSWLGASCKIEISKLPLGQSRVDGCGVPNPVTKEKRGGSDCGA